MMLIPLCGLGIFSSVTIYDHVKSTRETKLEIDSVTELSHLGTIIASSIHEWQKERGRSAGYLGSNGNKFANEIRAQYGATDEAVQSLEAALRANDFKHQPAEFHAALHDGLAKMEKLQTLRENVLSLRVPGREAVGTYTSLITSFLKVIDTSAKLTKNSEISLLLVSYSNFLQAKENMGIERAVLSNAFGADKFNSDFYKSFCTVLANQSSYLSSFQAFATQEHIDFYTNTVRGNSVDQVAAYEKLAFEKSDTGGFGVQPEDWFARITDKIDLMKQVEDHIAESVLKSSARIQSANQAKFFTLLIVAVGIASLTLAFSFWIARATRTSLRKTVFSLTTGVDEVAAASGQVSQASLAMASAASEQSTSLTHTSGILANITEITENNGQLAADANSITAEARTMVDESLLEMRTLQNAMDEIRTSSDEISAIIKTIDEIAFQTNILALNAAVEAARAGEAGAGFAVVADEVRNLAQRSAQAANDTTRKIEDSIKRAHNGTSISATVGTVLEKIVGKVREVDDVVTKIDEASKQQLSAILDIRTAVNQQEEVVTGAASSTEETASSAEELHSQAEYMQLTIRELAVQAGIDISKLPQIESKQETANPFERGPGRQAPAIEEHAMLWN